MISLTNKALAYLALAYAFIFLSLGLRTPWLTVFVLPIATLLFIPITLPKHDVTPIVVERKIQPTRCVADEDVNVVLTVTNISPNPIHSLMLEDNLPVELNVTEGAGRFMLSIEKGESRQIEYQITRPRRGSYQIGPTLIRISDSMGLHTLNYSLANTDELTVIPDVEKLGIVELKGKRFGPWPGLVPSRRIGVGTGFFEISPYVPGDDLRRINWKASARSGGLVTNEFEGEQVIDVFLVLDCSEDVNSELFDYDVLEMQVNFAASLSSQLIMQGDRVGLSVYGAARTWVSPGFGKRHLLRLLDNLAFVKAGRASLPIQYATEAILSTILPARSLVILISPVLRDEVVQLAENISANRFSVLCFTPSLRPKIGLTNESSRIARKILETERRLRVLRLKRIADVIQLTPDLTVKAQLKVKPRWNRT